MSFVNFGRYTAKLKVLLGIRARLILLALILVVPLMLDRVRILEDGRSRQIDLAATELLQLANHAADAQREIVSTVQAVLKSSAYIYSAAREVGRGCSIMRASLRVDLPWIRTLSVVGPDGKIQCSTNPRIVGIDLSDREYFRQSLGHHEFVLSDYIFSRAANLPSIIAAYPVSAVDGSTDHIIIAAIDLKWLSQLMANRKVRAGLSAYLVDGNGVILAAQPDNGLVGQRLKETSLLEAVALREINLDRDNGSISFMSAQGEKQVVNFARVSGTRARMIVSIKEAALLGDINHEIRTAYAQFVLVLLVALLGAWFVGDRLIINPIRVLTSMARRFGQGDLSARASKIGLPREFKPLARAFNYMASRLAQRERDLVATNDRLTVMASIDMVSGLANRRGFQSRLEFEWLKAEQDDKSLALLMIDVDHFKLFNDTYGHPEGDTCLGRVGEALAAIANDTASFAARYGGEEFCLIVPDADSEQALRTGELVRATIENLGIVHDGSAFRAVTVSIGVSAVRPGGDSAPEDLVEAADAALYAAKRRGRNLVVEHALIRTAEQAVSLVG
ncbi:diguanylate cyclase domain-containing protein [Afipia sp. TerB]